ERQLEIIERNSGVGGRILDRESSDSGLDAQFHALGHALGRVRKAALEVGVHGNVGGGSDLAEMGEHRRARHAAVREALREGEARAGRGERLESETLQIARRAHVPGVGDDEASLRVEFWARWAVFGGGGHGEPLLGSGEWVRAIVSSLRRCVGWTGRRAYASRKRWSRGPWLLREGSPCRRSPIAPPAGANSCSFWP